MSEPLDGRCGSDADAESQLLVVGKRHTRAFKVRAWDVSEMCGGMVYVGMFYDILCSSVSCVLR